MLLVSVGFFVKFLGQKNDSLMVEYVKMPLEQVAAYWAAVEVIAGLLSGCSK
jgi:hypothetical protein